MSKGLKGVIIGLGAIVLVAAGIIALFFNELKTLSTLKKEDAYGFYTMTYAGDYGFDEFLLTGAKNDREIEKFVMKRLLKGIEIDLNISSAGCTAFCAKNTEGDVLYGRNFDFEYAPSVLVKTKPQNGYASVSMVNLAFAGYGKDNLPDPLRANSFLTLAAPYLPFNGMNERGVTMALLAVPYAEPPQKEGQITLNTTAAIRMVLDKAATVEEALALLRQYNYYFSGDVQCHYLIADASGKSVVVEFMEGDVQVIEPNRNYQVVTNFILYKGLNKGEGYTEFERFDTADNFLHDTNGVISEKEAMALLSGVQIPDATQWSTVYNITKQSASICINRNYEKIYFYDFTR